MEIMPNSEAVKLSSNVMKYIKKARFFRIRVDLPGITDLELEKQVAIDGLKKGFDVLNISKINRKGPHKKIYVDLRVKN